MKPHNVVSREEQLVSNALSRRAMLQGAAAAAVTATGFARTGSAWSTGSAPRPRLPRAARGKSALATPAIAPFTYHAPQSALDDLRQRLTRARWPERETAADWSQGVPLAKLRALVEHWRTDYDWRRGEAALNGFDQFRTEIDGLGIHFLHVRSPHADALPIIITHGWPGSVIEFFKIIGPLTNPTAHGGEAQDAFHVVAPSLPGFGFSGKPTERGWNAERIAKAWAELMRRLGYDSYVAQGGDWGAVVTTEIARQKPAGLAAIHLNMPLVIPDPIPTEGLSKEEQRAVGRYQRFLSDGFGYFHLQATRPQTIGYALTDSPVGQAAWIYEKFQAWTDNDGDPESALTRDEMLDNITLYWLTETAASSARMYLENADVIGDPPCHPASRRVQHFPPRDRPRATPLGRACLSQSHSLERAGPRRPFCRVRAADAFHSRAARLLPLSPLSLTPFAGGSTREGETRQHKPEETKMKPHKIASRDEWLAARKALLAEEKKLTRLRDQVSAARRALPWVKVEKAYVFDTPEGKKTLADLFGWKSQLIVYHFMFGPGWKQGCDGCSFLADHIDGANLHLKHHDVSLVAVSRAPLAEFDAYKRRMGWQFPWVSSAGSDFNFDFHVSATKEDIAQGKVYYNFAPSRDPGEEMPGLSVFYKDDAGNVFHTYSTYARGLDLLVGAYNYLDLTPKGRNETTIMDWVRRHDEYAEA